MREIPGLLGFVLAFIALYVSELRIMSLSIVVMGGVVLFGLFILDTIIFGFNVALPAYFQKIAVTKDEITSNLSVEQVIQHIAAIIVPSVGGVVWEKYGVQALFLFGVVIVLAGLVLAQQMRVPSAPVPARA